MSSLLWLLLYLAPLLALTAVVFAWFGWQWRGHDLLQRIQKLQAQIDAEQRHAKPDAPAPDAPAEVPVPNGQADVTELNALREDLAGAQAEVRLRLDEAAEAHEATRALEIEMARVLEDLKQMRAAHAAAQEEIDGLRDAAAEESPPPAKPKRKRTTAKTKASATSNATTLREIIAALESRLSAHQASITTLTQERDDWQNRIRELESSSTDDPTGLKLARRSLAESETRLATVTTEIERLQNQIQVLLHVEAEAAALADVPDDDLTQIKGIKKITSEQLRAHGIRTWRQIALWNDQEQRAFSELLTLKNRATREQWQEQARTLHAAAHGTLL